MQSDSCITMKPVVHRVPPLRRRSHPPIQGLFMPSWDSSQWWYGFGDEASEIHRKVQFYDDERKV